MNIIPIFIPHLGCPNDCVFCNQRAIAAPQVPSIEDVYTQIQSALPHAPNAEIAFYGGSFTAIDHTLMVEYLTIAKKFIDEKKCVSIRVSTRPDAISDDILALLRSYGVSTVELGVQSMCDDVLRASKRGHTSEQVVHAAHLVHSYNFVLGLQMMVGLPLDNAQKSIITAEKIRDLAPNFVRIYPVCVIENTELENMWKTGRYTPISITQAVQMSADAYMIFKDANIDIARVGLNPTDELSSGGVLCGGYHPALGEMVKSEVMYREIVSTLNYLQAGARTLIIEVNTSDISICRGQKNTNLQRLSERFYPASVKIVGTDALARGKFKISVA